MFIYYFIAGIGFIICATVLYEEIYRLGWKKAAKNFYNDLFE